MTPQQKANELLNKFYNYVFNPESHKDDNLKWAKQCALIAVYEILKVAFYATDEMYNYYLEVKQEIEQL